ncbi:hypothetical protein PoMZ_07975 [Pyricularia oryzae]|uniref:Uncharacterized protein n=2 Tax=Pyricularia oryzae TaxID=318829 RepID=A0A4P7NGF7_PYROR|nr:hypothetical protein PoMZ_07975 [Pyricularia oryzae]
MSAGEGLCSSDSRSTGFGKRVLDPRNLKGGNA